MSSGPDCDTTEGDLRLQEKPMDVPDMVDEGSVWAMGPRGRGETEKAAAAAAAAGAATATGSTSLDRSSYGSRATWTRRKDLVS